MCVSFWQTLHTHCFSQTCMSTRSNRRADRGIPLPKQQWSGLAQLLHLDHEPSPEALGERVKIGGAHDLDWDAAVCFPPTTLAGLRHFLHA